MQKDLKEPQQCLTTEGRVTLCVALGEITCVVLFLKQEKKGIYNPLTKECNRVMLHQRRVCFRHSYLL